MGSKLSSNPRELHFAARHHMIHHAHDSGRYNVFLPIFDWLVDSRQVQRRIRQHP